MSTTTHWEVVYRRRNDSEGVVGFEVDRLERFRVPGGWIYRSLYWEGEKDSVSLVFVPDTRSNDDE